MNPIDPRRSERHLLAAAHRWARANGWQLGVLSPWSNGEYRVKWEHGELSVWRRDGTYWPQYPIRYPVATVVQAVDVLVALDILPAWLSSAYGLAEDRYREQVETLEEELGRQRHRTAGAERSHEDALRRLWAAEDAAIVGGAQ